MRTQVAVAAAFCALAILVRLPWFFVDVIDIDESTFIVMGRSLLEGHLPYIDLWENKPPLGFGFFALAQFLVPNSLAFIRFSGTLLVAATAFLVFRLSLHSNSVASSVLSGVLTVVAISLLIPSAEAVMMEHVALVPLVGAVTLAVGTRSRARMVAIGALLGTAALVRMNLAIPAVAMVVGVVALSGGTSASARIANGLWVCVGGVLPLAASFLPYLLSGQSGVYFRALFLVPFEYSISHMSAAAVLVSMSRMAVPSLDPLAGHARGSVQLLLWIGGAIGLMAPLLSLRRGRGTGAVWTLIAAGTVGVSILGGGHAWGHYLIQMVPFFAVGAGCLLGVLRLPKGFINALTVAIVLFGAVSVWQGYRVLATTWRTHGRLYSGETFALAEELQRSARVGDTYFFTTDVLPYWILGQRPLIPLAVFPANILREDEIVKPLYGPDYDTARVVREVFDKRPSVVVTEDVDDFSTYVEPFRRILATDYSAPRRVHDRLIYRRK